jgi:predicted nuclease with TOPRIM domain
MADLHQSFSSIEKLTHQLIEKYEQAVRENTSLKDELQSKSEEIKEYQTRLELLEGELKSAKIARAVAISSEDNELAKAKISTLTREIDRCIALLNE